MSEINKEVLCETADDMLLKKFPFNKYHLTRGELRDMRRKLKTASQGVVSDRVALKNRAKLKGLEKKYEEALKAIDELSQENRAITAIRGTVDTHVIKPKKNATSSEATAVWVASDWHHDEVVESSSVNGLNHFTAPIARRRIEMFFTSGLRLTNILADDVKIETIVLALLGDFYTGHIHPDFMELTDTQPIHAVIRVQNMIASGIQYILDNSMYNLVIPCHSGNHARTTEKTRFATENGHSLEFYMYGFLADHFKSEKRVKFLISEGYHSFLDIYGTKIRFHHGHAIKFGGGVGGITIPTQKAIAAWNNGVPDEMKADLDVFGHFHQMLDGGNFVCNGSLIGYSNYARVQLKARFDKPKQVLFLVDSKRGKTCVWPILLE